MSGEAAFAVVLAVSLRLVPTPRGVAGLFGFSTNFLTLLRGTKRSTDLFPAPPELTLWRSSSSRPSKITLLFPPAEEPEGSGLTLALMFL